MFALAIWTWPSAPAQIPLHWNIAGQIDGYGSKFTGLLLLPIVALAGYALIGLTPVLRREKFDDAAMSALSWFRLTYVALMAGVFCVIIAEARGWNSNMNYVVLPLLALVMITSANLVVQLRRLKATNTSPPGSGLRV
jgi:uncharacterized membrane protein